MLIVVCGCAGLYNGVVTVTQVRDSAMHELAVQRKAGLISNETDAKIESADAKYRQAAELAAKSLVAYKESGDKTQYIAALQATKVAVTGILDILTPLVAHTKSVELQTQLLKASTL